ncbi:MAG: alpha/beta hydrolase [Chloroflexota bacterium]
MPHVDVDGLKLNYRDTSGDNPAIVLIHGYTGNTRNWALNIPALREKYRCVSFDLPGHGESDRSEDATVYSLEAMSERVVGAMKALDIERATLMGHSMGGMVSGYIAVNHTEMLRALVLVDTAAEPLAERSELRRRLVGAVKAIETERGPGGMEAVFDLHLQAATEAGPLDDRFVTLWREQFLMTSLDAYIHCAEAMAGRETLIPRLRELSLPTLIVCGENDLPFLQASHNMNEAIAGSELAIITGAGHSPTFETPAAFNEVLLRFLSRVHAGAAV